MAISILIPAYNPNERLLSLVDTLLQHGFRQIIVVDDGSQPQCSEIFSHLKSFPECFVLRHAVNQGKGRALKTGLNFFYLNLSSQSSGVVTVDADGQHTPEDILKVARHLESNNNSLILGSRQFNSKIPLRSLLGNVITRIAFSLLVGKKISDTQTGLRGIPTKYVLALLSLDGERFEYEINMLIYTKMKNIPIVEENIHAIYIENNRSSHFNPLVDSMRIYFLLFRFAFSSLSTSLIDLLVFTLTYSLLNGSILTSIITARLIASIFNFNFNRKYVFHCKTKLWFTMLKYYILVISIMSLAYILVYSMVNIFGINVILAKVLTELILFIASFSIQRDFIFSKKEEVII